MEQIEAAAQGVAELVVERDPGEARVGPESLPYGRPDASSEVADMVLS